jgi:hypothetical protein
LWCSGVRFVARLFDRRATDRGQAEVTVVRHQVTGWELRFESASEAHRFLQHHCCEPSAFEVALGDGAEARRAAA